MANSHTLGSFSTTRIRWADIAVVFVSHYCEDRTISSPTRSKSGACVLAMIYLLWIITSSRVLIFNKHRNKSLQGYTCNWYFYHSSLLKNKVIAFLLANFTRYCPYVVHVYGFHRYKQGFLVYILFIWRLYLCCYKVTFDAPRLVKVTNCAVDMNSWAQLACYPRGSFYPLICTGV